VVMTWVCLLVGTQVHLCGRNVCVSRWPGHVCLGGHDTCVSFSRDKVRLGGRDVGVSGWS